MSDQTHTPRTNVARTMLLGAGVFFLFCAVVYNPWLIDAAVGFVRTRFNRPWTPLPDAGPIRRMEMMYLGIGAILTGVGVLTGAIADLDRFFRRGVVASLVLAFLTLFVPIATLEIALRPFTLELGKETSLFVKDRHLGWKLRPSATEMWGGVSATINQHGYRGPDVEYEKPPGTLRVLHLGDSVAFGYMVERWQDTFPFIMEDILERDLGTSVETINTGVGGYSPWQELILLQSDGIRYQPDVVVINFVLNDVTEKFTLVRYGGYEESRQLRDSYYSWIDEVVARSALGYQVRNLAREWKARRVLGSDPQLAAIKKEAFDVETMIREPQKEHIREAWRITLTSLQAIFDFCETRNIPVLLVIHPFRMQLDDPAKLSAPQMRLSTYARAHGVRTVDILPILHRHIRDTGATADSFFIDHDHLSVAGHRFVAGVLADSVRVMLAPSAR